jgi:hypothetical protein
MNEFLVITLSYPTVIFTVLLGVAFVYWLLVIVGAIGVDTVDIDVDGATEGAAEGAAEGASEGASEGAADGVAAAVLTALRLRKAPLTFVLSLVFFWGWFFCHMGMVLLAPAVSFLPSALTSTTIAIAALLFAFPLTSLCVAPMARLFHQERQRTHEDLVGQIVRIATGSVDGSFGTANADDDGPGLIVQVRCDVDNDLGRGDKALVLSWDEKREAYEVTPMTDLLPPKLSEK